MSLVLLDFSLTVKAAALIFISGCCSANKGNQVLFIIWIRINRLFGPRKRACFSCKA